MGPESFRGRKMGSVDLRLVLLTLLAERPSHGYELIKALEDRSGGFYSPSPGMQRKSDGTSVIDGRRFEVPDHYRHLTQLEVRYASWDLSLVHLVDERTGKVLCRLFPQNKAQNASGLRRARDELAKEPPAAPPAAAVAPLLQKLLRQQADMGLPPAYLPKDERPEDEGDAS